MAARALGSRARRIARALVGASALVLATVVGGGGCASAPFYRPVAPPFTLDEHGEVGVGAHAAFSREEMGTGTGGWAHARMSQDLELVLRGHGTDIFKYDGDPLTLRDVLAGGSLGLRGRFRFRPTMYVGGEVLLDYQARTGGNNEQLVSGILGVPVAEQVVPGLWVYTEILLGISVDLQNNPQVPMFGFQEAPIGVVWQPLPFLLLVAEGGMSLPVNGGYGGLAAAVRF